MTLSASVAVALTAAALTGCASAARPDSATPFTEAARPTSVQILVNNRNFSDARLYTIRRGGREFLGIVGGKQEGTFRVDWAFPDELEIEINLLAGPTCRTEKLPVDPGDILDLMIEPVFSQSSACGRQAAA
jgi:hypothetical protein